MIERRPVATFVSHLVLMLGVAVVAFPLLLALVASTQSPQEIAQSFQVAKQASFIPA